MLSILTQQSNVVDFELSLNGDVTGEVDVVFTIVTESVEYRLKASHKDGSNWSVTIPEVLPLTSGEYTYNIDVIMDSHIYPAITSTLQAKQSLKPTVKIASAVSESQGSKPAPFATATVLPTVRSAVTPPAAPATEAVPAPTPKAPPTRTDLLNKLKGLKGNIKGVTANQH